MASKLEFVEYVCEQIKCAGSITYKKMFGEYAVYCNDKLIALICDNQFFVKPTESGREILENAVEAPPYKGAKPSFLIENIDDREMLTNLIITTYNELPAPKPKKIKSK